MKIAIVTDAWQPQVNGVVTTYQETIKCLRLQGHSVCAVTPEFFRTVKCPTYPEIPLSIFPGRKMDRILEEFNPDAVHVATEGPLGWAGRSWCIRNRLGFTTSYHTRFPEYVKMRFPVPLSLSYRVVRRFHSAAVRTMVATEDLENELDSRGFYNLCRWSRGVDLSLFKPSDERLLKEERPIALYAGRVAVEKNIEAFLSLDIPFVKYVVGDGPARTSLEAKYPDVRFTGMKRGEELSRHFASADVFVFPSLTDTFGIVMLEAMACGVPVAAYPVTGPRQVVRNGINGCLCKDLHDAVMGAVVLDRTICRATVLKYSWDECTNQFLNNLHRLKKYHEPVAAKGKEAPGYKTLDDLKGNII